MPETADELHHALVKEAWPDLSEDSEEFRRQKRLVTARLPQIRKAAKEVRPHADRAMNAKDWLPSFKLLAGLGCAAFSGLPWLVLLLMIPIFMAFMGSFCEAYAFAERAAKYCNRKAAQGFRGLREELKYALELLEALPETAALEPLKVFLEQIGVVDDPYRYGDSIGSAHYTATFLDKGVRLKFISMVYSLTVLAMCICAIPAIAALRAGCNFGEQSTLRCINGAPQAKSAGEGRVGDDLVNRDAKEECNTVSYAFEHVEYRDRHDGPVAAFCVRERIGTKNAPFVPSGVMPDGWEELDSNWFYVFGENKKAFDADFADKYERLSGIYLNGKPSGNGAAQLEHYRTLNGCNGSWMGGPFCMAIWNPSGSYDASGRFGGVRDGEWVKDIGRQLFGHPRERLVCRRANKIQVDFYANEHYRKEVHGGADDYALHDAAKRTERDEIQDLGHYGFLREGALHLLRRVAVNCGHRGRRQRGRAGRRRERKRRGRPLPHGARLQRDPRGHERPEERSRRRSAPRSHVARRRPRGAARAADAFRAAHRRAARGRLRARHRARQARRGGGAHDRAGALPDAISAAAASVGRRAGGRRADGRRAARHGGADGAATSRCPIAAGQRGLAGHGHGTPVVGFADEAPLAGPQEKEGHRAGPVMMCYLCDSLCTSHCRLGGAYQCSLSNNSPST